MSDAKPVKSVMLVKTNIADNNNKFYEVNLYADGTVVGRNGRVGTPGVLQNKGAVGEAGYEKLVNEKKKGLYREVERATQVVTATGGKVVNESLATIAKRDIANNNPDLDHLITKLEKQNRFQLVAATGGQIDIIDGVVSTPVGPVTVNAVAKARSALVDLQSFVQKGDQGSSYVATLEDYLHYVPQKIPLKRGWGDTFFTDFTNFVAQNQLLDQLESSILAYKAPDPVVDDGVVKPQTRLFGYSLSVLDDAKKFEQIRKFYADNVNRGHACSHLKLKRVYVISNDQKEQEYKAVASKLGNEQRLWHGTRAHNVLSILKGGLIIPTSAGGYTITGRMFGDGLYFSDQSSKSLNYAYGYWSGSRDNNCFMFLAEVAMGKAYTPSGPTGRLPPGFDSMFAMGGRSGVQNNEMIVYKLSQAHLSYLCEFDA